MNYNLFIARRLFAQGGTSKKVSRPAILIATAGIALGLAVMIVSVCVVLGFKDEVRDKVTGFGSHIQVINLQSIQSAESQPIRFSPTLRTAIDNVPGVSHSQPFVNKAGMLKTDDAFRGVMFHGIDSTYDLSFLRQHLVEGTLPFQPSTLNAQPSTLRSDQSDACPGKNSITISRLLANQLQVGLGDKIYAYFFDRSVRARRFTVDAIFETHMTDFDNSIVFADLSTCQKLCGWDSLQYSGLELHVDDFSRLEEIDYYVSMALHMQQDADGSYYAAPTIRQLHPGIFSWLTLLDTNVWVILALMIAVASFTMISGLLIIILERTNFIGIMKALGATNSSLRSLFLYFAAFIISRGLILGNLIAFILIVLQSQFGIVHLDPVTYYVDTVPLHIDWLYILLINLATLLISLLVLIVPSFVVSHIHPAKSIRFE